MQRHLVILDAAGDLDLSLENPETTLDVGQRLKHGMKICDITLMPDLFSRSLDRVPGPLASSKQVAVRLWCPTRPRLSLHP